MSRIFDVDLIRHGIAGFLRPPLRPFSLRLIWRGHRVNVDGDLAVQDVNERLAIALFSALRTFQGSRQKIEFRLGLDEGPWWISLIQNTLHDTFHTNTLEIRWNERLLARLNYRPATGIFVFACDNCSLWRTFSEYFSVPPGLVQPIRNPRGYMDVDDRGLWSDAEIQLHLPYGPRDLENLRSAASDFTD